MPDFVLTLDDVGFTDMEVPEEITNSLEQAVVLHKYPGGARTLDAMGPQRSDFTWSGYLMDERAEERCQQLETMTAAGLPVTLSYGQRLSSVVITKLETKFERFYHIPYTITLQVVQDLETPVLDDAENAGTAISRDVSLLGTLQQVLATIGAAAQALIAAIDAVTAAIQAVDSIVQATVNEIFGLISAVVSAYNEARFLATHLDAALEFAGNQVLYAAGVDPYLMVGSVNNLVQAATFLPTVFSTQATLGRINYNLHTIQG